MSSISSKKFVVAICGSIAAYKAAFLVRNLIKQGAEVRVIMTPTATRFISSLSLSTLSKHDVYTEVVDENSWNNHVEMGLWADAMIIAPATATSLAKMANGISDSIVTAVYLSAKCPVFFAPAMDLDMWKHPATQSNIKTLESFGNIHLGVGDGELASGLHGEGRMLEPEEIIEKLENYFSKKKDLTDKKVLITAGPTYENIDPVRFIGNPSSGKMGVALAQECASRGAEVQLVLGPSRLDPQNESINTSRVESAAEMYEACEKWYSESDIVIFAAAVSDYTPLSPSDIKIKKKEGDLDLRLKRTVDIAATLGAKKTANQIHIGFALESGDGVEYAKAKIVKKAFDLIVLNTLQDQGAGFKHDTNKVTIIDKDNKMSGFELKSKSAVAIDIVDAIVNLIEQ